MRLVFKTVFLYLTLASFFSCDKDNNVVYVYAQTYCADAWGCATGAEGITNNACCLGDYLDAEGIEYSKITYDNSGGAQVCDACSCLSGYQFKVSTLKDFETELLNLGFVAGE